MKDVYRDRQYWDDRSRDFSKLEWASRQGYVEMLVQAGDLRSDDVVLDIGTGTGIIARAVAPFVETVVGVDISEEMIKASKATAAANCECEIGDARNLRFPTGHFSRAFARMVFHGLIESGDAAAKECCRVLRPGGKFILSEGIPPSPAAEPWYTEMFRLKEERLTFSPEILQGLLSRAGLTEVQTLIHISPQVSIANWLENGSLSSDQRRELMQVHLDMPAEVRKAYNATFTESDVFLDMKFAIVVGTKPNTAD